MAEGCGLICAVDEDSGFYGELALGMDPRSDRHFGHVDSRWMERAGMQNQHISKAARSFFGVWMG